MYCEEWPATERVDFGRLGFLEGLVDKNGVFVKNVLTFTLKLPFQVLNFLTERPLLIFFKV